MAARAIVGWLSLLLAGTTAQAAPVAGTASGTVEGVSAGKVDAFLGIPYAAPPIGDRRWRPPAPMVAWSGTRPTTRFGANCWQAVAPEGFGPWTHEYVVPGNISEDCLFLNVWRPAKARGPLPVLVWIHGGGFNSGSGALPIYDGRALAEQGIVVVTINYRVGALGFLAHPELTREANTGANGNFGVQDMIAALAWVKANIAAFGGDAAAVTIAGQSAGSMAVHDLIASPLARGLFARAIGQSGLPTPARTVSLARAEAEGVKFAQEKGAASLAALRAIPAEALQPSRGANAVRFGPMLDGKLLPSMAAASDVPMLVGFNADEGSALGQNYGAPDQASLDALMTTNFGSAAPSFASFYPASTDAERIEANRQVRRDRALGGLYAWASKRGGRQPVFGYLYEHVEPGPQSARWMAFHSSEIPYVFRTLDASPERSFGASDRAMSAQISTYWLNFIKTGNPNGAGLPRWPSFDAAAPAILAIGDNTHSRPLLPADKMAAMKAYLAQTGEAGGS